MRGADVRRIGLAVLPTSIVTPAAAAAAAQTTAKEEKEHERVRRCNSAEELGVRMIENWQASLLATQQYIPRARENEDAQGRWFGHILWLVQRRKAREADRLELQIRQLMAAVLEHKRADTRAHGYK
jgi:demethoxyubiquinone hydroxylase (CLK1/Coq7/Cat5 family)